MIRRPPLFSIFAKSPFKRLEQHMQVVSSCVRLLPKFFECCQKGDWKEAEQIATDISKLESDADRLKRKLQVKLHSDLFLPVPRSDVLGLLQVQDNIANKVEDLTHLMIGRQMIFPEPIHDKVRLLVDHTIKACQKATEVNAEMRDLLEAGFEGVVLKLLQDMVGELDVLEDEADSIQADIRQSIFSIEQDYPPLDVLFWYQFVQELSSVIDWAQRVGSQLLIISSR